MSRICINKTESYDEFIKKVIQVYKDRNWVYYDFSCNSNLMKRIVENWRNNAFNLAFAGYKPSYPGYNAEENNNFTEISKYFACGSEEEVYKKIGITKFNRDSNFYKCMIESFFGLALVHEEVGRCFMRAYMLWQNSVAVGCAGYSKRLQKDIPYYFTFFNKKVLFINPIVGIVKWLDVGVGTPEKLIIEKNKETVDVVLKFQNRKIQLCRWFENEKRLAIQRKAKKGYSDRKAAERDKKNELGHKIKETAWQTTDLGEFKGSKYNIRTHSIICLMVYGIESMLLALMGSNSILSVDHISGKHSDNRIDNLMVVSNHSNNVKKGKENYYGFMFDFGAFFLGLPQTKEIPITEESIEEIRTEIETQQPFDWDVMLTPEQLASMYGFSIVY